MRIFGTIVFKTLSYICTIWVFSCRWYLKVLVDASALDNAAPQTPGQVVEERRVDGGYDRRPRHTRTVLEQHFHTAVQRARQTPPQWGARSTVHYYHPVGAASAAAAAAAGALSEASGEAHDAKHVAGGELLAAEWRALEQQLKRFHAHVLSERDGCASLWRSGVLTKKNMKFQFND